MPDEPITSVAEDALGQPQVPKEIQVEVPSLNQPAQFPRPFTDFSTGDLVRLRSGGPVMTLGTVLPTHTLNTQVACKWFGDGLQAEVWAFLGQLEVVSAEEAKLQNSQEKEERDEARKLKEERQHELAKIRAAIPQPQKK